MGWFHQLAADSQSLPPTVWHMCPAKDYNKDSKASYFPAAYDIDKFTRALHEPSRLMETANCFYQESSPADEKWICLQIDTMTLKVEYIEVIMEASETDPDLQCPKIFGGLPTHSVKAVYPIVRDESTGEFLFVKGLTDSCQKK